MQNLGAAIDLRGSKTSLVVIGHTLGVITYEYGSKPWYLVNPKIAGKWMFIPLKMVLIGIDPHPYGYGSIPMKIPFLVG
jgi:hypothetical protein